MNVRPIGYSDADGLVRFHESLSTDSQRSRFFAIHPHLSLKEVERFTNVDHRDRQAFVAVMEDEIVGVGRYDRLDGSDAEVAFVTRDDHQGLGIATLLFQELVTAAEAVGITRFVAETLPENHKMLDLFTRTGLVSGRAYGRGVVEITMPLPGHQAARTEPGVSVAPIRDTSPLAVWAVERSTTNAKPCLEYIAPRAKSACPPLDDQ